MASFNNASFPKGYFVPAAFALPQGNWKEIFNSDSESYGGENVGNAGATLSVVNGGINPVMPARGLIVFQRV